MPPAMPGGSSRPGGPGEGLPRRSTSPVAPGAAPTGTRSRRASSGRRPAATSCTRMAAREQRPSRAPRPSSSRRACEARQEMTSRDYERDGAEIYRRSFETIRAEADLGSIPGDLEKLAVRVVHSCGMVDVVRELRFSPGAGERGRDALAAGAPVLADSRMVAEGITRRRLPAANEVVCTLNDSEVAAMAEAMGTTRAAAAVDLWLPRLGGAVVAIGNAPTALWRLLELLDAGAPRPALILGFPVGFVGAAESKQALAEEAHGVPFVTLLGRRGGSAMAAAAVNALAAERE